MRKLSRIVRTTLGLVMLWAAGAGAQQSDNNALHAVPPPKATVVDGKLDDWDLSGQIEIFANYRTRATYSAKVAAMYDKDFFYLSIVWRDPTPLQNMVDANFEIGSGWKSDCIQLRLKTDVPMHLDCWYSTTASKPVINIQYGMHEKKSAFYMPKLEAFAAANALDVGAKEAFCLGEDGKSYTQELALPWKLITGGAIRWKEGGKPVSERTGYVAGEQFNMGMEFLWGGPDGRTFPIHRYADLVKEGTSSREFFWTAENAWGPVILEPKGHLTLPAPDYASRMEAYLQKTAGPVKLPYTMPFDGFVTLVVENEQGGRVKNVVGMAPRSKGQQTDFWDGTDELGQLVPVGKYRFRGLVHQGIEPVYDATYGTPGTPPWDTGDGAGAWLSDHTPPRAVAAGGDMMVLGAERGESGYAIIGTDLNGRKKWGDRTFIGINSIGADADYVYAYLSAWDVKDPVIGRLELKTGKYAPFATAAGPRLKVPVFKEGEKHEWTPGLAVGPDRIAMPLCGAIQVVRFFDKKTGAIVGELPVPELGAVAYDTKGTLYVWSAGQLMKVVEGKLEPFINQPAQKFPAGIAFDDQGRVFMVERETNQIRMYDNAGTFVRAIGVPGGRPKTGKWQPNGLLNPAALAVDVQGRIWVAEEDSSPKRISVWNSAPSAGSTGSPQAGSGQATGFVRDFIGPTGYGGSGANADPDDKTRVFGSGCEFKLDYATNRATIVAALGDVSGELMKIQGREYIMSKTGRLYLRTGAALRQVAAVGTPLVKGLGELKDIPLPEVPKGTHGYASYTFMWSDLNDDGTAQPEEVTTGSRWTGWDKMKFPVGTSGYFGSYWLDADFSIVGIATESFGPQGGNPRGPFLTKTPIKGWTKGGAPIWDLANQKVICQDAKLPGPFYMAADGINVTGMTGVRDDGTVLWTYKDQWPGVHGSHDAPIPERDDTLIGTLGCIGRVKTPVGTVFGLHSNMGRLYLMTMDGLFVASVFQDCRLGSDPWPSEARRGAPLGGVTMGSEWFGGHLFKSEKTDEYYLIAGFTAYNLIKLNGLATLQALPATKIEVSVKDVQVAEKLQQEGAAKLAAKNALVIAKMPAEAAAKLGMNLFRRDSFVEWSSGPYRIRGAVAVDASTLYLAVDVSGDNNPMVNGGKDVNQLFVTGDSVNLELGANAGADPKRKDAVPGDVRLLISVLDTNPVAVLYRWKVAEGKNPVTFSSPWRSHVVDRVDVIQSAKIQIGRSAGGYNVVASVPLSELGFKPEAGKEYRLDLGVIFSDAKGDNRVARVYWSNKATGLVADVPGEIMATPQLWGTGKAE